jgi:hypothetical protein
LAEDRSDSPADQQRKLESAQDSQVEELTRQLAAVVNSAAAEGRQDLRDYAIGLLKEETELAEAPPTPPEATHATRFNPLAIALLLVLASLPLFLSIVFAPVGLALLGLAALMGIWGLLASVFARRRR